MRRLVALCCLTFLVSCGSSSKKSDSAPTPEAPVENDPRWFRRAEALSSLTTLRLDYTDIRSPVGCVNTYSALCDSIDTATLSLENLETALNEVTYFKVEDAYRIYERMTYAGFRTAYAATTYGTYADQLFYRITAESLRLKQMFERPGTLTSSPRL